MRAYLALFKSNMRLTLRDRAVLFFNYLFPLIFFFAFAELFHAGAGAGIAYFVSTVLIMGILGNGLWGAGMRSVQEREANILRRFKVTPISPAPHPGRRHGQRLAALPSRRRHPARGAGPLHLRHAHAAELALALLDGLSLGVCSLPRHRPDAGRRHQHHAGGHDRHTAPLHAHALPQRRHHPLRDAAQVGADRRRIHARLVPGHRLPGHLLPQPERSPTTPPPSSPCCSPSCSAFPRRAALPLGEGRKDPRRATSSGCSPSWPRSC